MTDKKNDMEVDRAAAIKEWKQKACVTVVFYTGFFLFSLGAILFGGSFIDQGYSLTPPRFNQLHEASGIFKTARSGRFNLFVVVDTKTNRRYSCNTGGASFKGFDEVIGKPVKVLAYENSIYQIEVDNVVRLDYSKRVKYLTMYKNTGILLLIPGIVVMVLVQRNKQRRKREANG